MADFWAVFSLLLLLLAKSSAFMHSQVSEQVVFDSEAIRQLSEVFDIPALKLRSRDVREDNLNQSARYLHSSVVLPPPNKREQLSPSLFMLNLYNTIADHNGVMRIPNPFNANLIRSFQNKDLTETGTILFDLSTMKTAEERVLQAQLHLKINTPSHVSFPHQVHLTLYQIFMVNNIPQRYPLLTQQLVIHSPNQTQVVPIRNAALQWIEDSPQNEGLEAVFSGQDGHGSEEDYSLAKRVANPTLIVFLDDGRQKHNSKYRIKSPVKQNAYLRSRLRRLGQEELISSFDWQTPAQQFQPKYQRLNMTVPPLEGSLRRRRRSIGGRKKKNLRKKYQSSSKARGPCRRHELFVNFEEIGWSSWIISPKGFQAFHCRGDCHFPIGQESKPSNHATVISIVNHMKLRKRVGAPCCVPEKLYSISLLYFDNEQNVVLKQYDDMVAQSCACR